MMYTDDTTNLLKLKTDPGQMIEIWRWEDGELLPFDDIHHADNLGPLVLPPGNYVYYIIADAGDFTIDQPAGQATPEN